MSRSSPARLQEGWVIANHILVSFHVAFISSVLALPPDAILKAEVLRFIFLSPETLASAFFVAITYHVAVAVHELGHYLAAARLNALNDRSQREAGPITDGSPLARAVWIARQFMAAPSGRASGIRREGLNYYPDAPYNLAVAAAGPRASRNLALVMLPPAALLLTAGLAGPIPWLVYAGRLALGIGTVGLLDFLLADPGKYREFRRREKAASEQAATVTASGAWWDEVAGVRRRLERERVQELTHPRLGTVRAPWQFRNCGMGGRHTEKEYPESNVSMQEAMFLILGAGDYQEAQEMTVRLQNRLKEIIEKADGCRVMGIGLEGGLAPYIERGEYPLPEVRLWAMMTQTIRECGLRPGRDVAIALDPAMTELEIAYREEFNVPDAVGQYLFWRDRTQTVLDRDGVLALYQRALQEFDIPILSIEDGFSEHDHLGWQNLLAALGDRVLVIGDDLVTTNDETIELAAEQGLINTALIKANQIGTLHETILAMLVALGKGHELVVSHRSKSPNDDMEAQIALAVNALGLKCGGGANTERLVKYQAVNELMQAGVDEDAARQAHQAPRAVISRIFAYEEPTNAGIPSVGATVELTLPDQDLKLQFRGATPLGTSAGTGEAIHLVDAMIEGAEHREVLERHARFFEEREPGVHAFRSEVRAAQVEASGDDGLIELFERARRYGGKGCLTAASNVSLVIAPHLVGRSVQDLTLGGIDRSLLELELELAHRRGKLADTAPAAERVRVMQRKQNLGMNAVLSVSLALARGLAHLQGKTLYELIREEARTIIDRLASTHGVAVEGAQFADYVQALRVVDAELTRQKRPLHEALRAVTGVYGEVEVSAPAEPVATAPAIPSVGGASDDSEIGRDTLGEHELSRILALNLQLHDVVTDAADPADRRRVLRRYLELKRSIASRTRAFGIVNNRVFRSGDELVVPYLIGQNLVVFRAPAPSDEPIFTERWHPGKLLTDGVIRELVGCDGDVVDLEDDLETIAPERLGPVRVGRIRDMAEQIRRIGGTASRPEAVYTLRFLVARLSLFSFRKYLHAKNLQSEVHQLLTELRAFLATPLAQELPLLVRILVRNVAGGVTKPKLIDHLWNDSIDLAEVHVRGSDIVNEIRRSTHHAIGRSTQALASAYLTYLTTGATEDLARQGYPRPGPADELARTQDRPRELVARLVKNLEALFGSTEIIDRIGEWRETYATTLVRCDTGLSLTEEAAKAQSEGIDARNRWAYYHHLRVLKSRVGDFTDDPARRADALARLDALLEQRPDTPDFDAAATSNDLHTAVAGFEAAIAGTLRDPLFAAIDTCIATYGAGDHVATYGQLFELRRSLREGLVADDLAAKDLTGLAFPEQRLLLLELDCLLEEMGYLALRQVSSRYEEQGVDLAECLDIIRRCALNLTHDGLHSRQIRDLVDMLADPTLTHHELASVLAQIQRNFHHMLRRLVAPFEAMREVLELEPDELRIALANMQRFLHDLNSMVAFTDLAIDHVDRQVQDRHRPIAPTAAAPERDPCPTIVHLSHRDTVRALVEADDPAVNVRRHYGGKGSGLIYISYLGIPTRDGFVISTADRDAARDPAALADHLAILEADLARRDGRPRTFGGGAHPLLLAVRGGSVFSMPGILATVLFVGMNDAVTETLARTDPWHAYDSYRRFLASYAQGVWQVDVEKHSIVETVKREHGVAYKRELPWEGMRRIAELTKQTLRDEGLGAELDEMLADPHRQLREAVACVQRSWNSDVARRYREIKGICDSWQTAVVVQEMASGNRSNPEIGVGMDEARASLTGVVPHTVVTSQGGRACSGEFKFSAAGEDLVGGLTTSISLLPIQELGTYMPMLDRRIRHTIATLRRFMGTDQEIEFTVEDGVLSVLQSRAAEVGVNREKFAFAGPRERIARGIGVRGSAFRGLVAFTADEIAAMRARLADDRDDVDGVILLLENPTPDDIPLLMTADALLAAKGGSTSHAAVAINGIGDRDYHAVVGASALRVLWDERKARVLGDDGQEMATLTAGDVVSIDGHSGAVFLGKVTCERL
jgi:enolase/phosphohistidine swiveling domain-containing protein